MEILQYIISIGFIGLGSLLAVINGWILIKQIRGQDCPSATPILGGLFLFIGGLLLPGGVLKIWAWLGLFLDYGCIPYLITALVSMLQEKRRYAAKNQILALEYDAGGCSGTISIYPKNECIHKWKAKDGNSSGSMVMQVNDIDRVQYKKVTPWR